VAVKPGSQLPRIGEGGGGEPPPPPPPPAPPTLNTQPFYDRANAALASLNSWGTAEAQHFGLVWGPASTGTEPPQNK